MSKKKKKFKSDGDGIVYSTNPRFSLGDLLQGALDDQESENEGMLLEAHLEKKGRAGKTAVIIKGFSGDVDALKELAKKLKAHCGVGGSVKDGEIIIQGNVRDKAMSFLKEQGHQVKRVGG